MPNINKNIIMQAGAAVANATNKAAGLSASTPEPGSIISAIQLVNGGRKIGPADVIHFTESVRNRLLSLLVSMEPIQSGSGTPAPDNVRPISGSTGLTIYVSPTHNVADATTYSVDWTTEAGTVCSGTLDVVTGVLTVDTVHFSFDGTENWSKSGTYKGSFYLNTGIPMKWLSDKNICSHAIVCNTFPVAYQFGKFGLDGAKKTNVNIWLMPSGSSKQDWLDYLAAQALAGTPVEMVCELATPVTYQLTGTDIVTLVGDNYIWSDIGNVTITE